jgi:outer membrane protein insertion porin family
LTGTVRLYNWLYSFDTYDKDSTGGSFGLGYPVFDYTRLSSTYLYDISNVKNVSEDASDSVKDLKGENIKSSVLTGLKYDSRNNAFLPRRGSSHGVSFEYAGLGGTIGFTKYLAETTWVMPLFGEVRGIAHAEGGYVIQNKDKTLPDYEKFYMGGIGSLRGFERDDLAPEDNKGNSVGGDKYVQFNFEVVFPLIKEVGVHGLLFFDTGNVYGEDVDVELDPASLRQSAGAGIRWLSPMGPFDIEYGYILDPKDSDHGPGQWEFTMTSSF